MTEQAIKVLMPGEAAMTICGKHIILKPLTMRQIYSVTAIIKTNPVNMNAGDAGIMQQLIIGSGEKIVDVVSILTGLTPEVVKDVTLIEVSLLAVALSKVNNFAEIFSNFQQAMELPVPAAKK